VRSFLKGFKQALTSSSNVGSFEKRSSCALMQVSFKAACLKKLGLLLKT
jgi:hypothetical protein